MTGPIHPDRFDQLCEDSRRLKFLEAYVGKHGSILIDNGHPNCHSGGRDADVSFHRCFRTGKRTLAEAIDELMVRYPELLEERSEVQAHD